MKHSIVRERSYAFALRIIALTRWLKDRKEYELAGQILRAGTGIGSNVEEASAGVSRADFTAKMSIASKEARESQYWLRLLRDSKIVPSEQISDLVAEAQELVSMLTATVKTSQLNTKH
jgi:four helix bundle protein